MLFAFSPVIWTYAVGAEVFAMNNAIATGLLYLALRYAAKREMKYAYYGALLSGIGMCNQHTIILLEIPIVLMVFWTERKVCLNDYSQDRHEIGIKHRKDR